MNIQLPHILIIPSWYPYDSKDIRGSFFREQAIALQKYSLKVGVISPLNRSLKDINGVFKKKYGLDLCLDNGVKTYRYHSVVFTPKFYSLIRKQWISKGLKLFHRYVKDNGKPDVIHVHSMTNGAYLAYEIFKQYQIPYVITEHSSHFFSDSVDINEINSLKEIVKESSSCIAVSQAFADKLNYLFNENKWFYLPNIVNDKFLMHELYDSQQCDFSFISVCMLNKNKNVDLIINAFHKVLKSNINAKLKIVGDGPQREKLESLVENLNIKENVSFLGLLNREDVIKEINTSNALLVASDIETFSVVLVEALALGKPVISTKCGGPESIISPEVGYLVKKNNIDEYVEAMLEVYHNKLSLFTASNIRRYCIDHFSEAAVVSELIKIYSMVKR